MGYLGLVFALVTVGYILGVWTALAVLSKPQRPYEDAVTESRPELPVRRP